MVVTKPTTQELDEAGPHPSSLTATSGARACDHKNDECDYAYSVEALMHDGSPLPDWLVYKQPILSINPIISSHIGVWLVDLKQVRISNGVTS